MTRGCQCGLCVPGGGPHYLQSQAARLREVNGLWPWPDAGLTFGEVHALYTAAGAPWIPDATQHLYPDDQGWYVRDRTIHRVTTDRRHLARAGAQRVGTDPYGVPVIEIIWEEVVSAEDSRLAVHVEVES